MADQEPPLDEVQTILDLQWLALECEERCILDGSKWAGEILSHAPAQWMGAAAKDEARIPRVEPLTSAFGRMSCRASFGRTLMLSKEFRRAEFFLEQTREYSERHCFLYFWCRYLKCVKDNLENDVESHERSVADVDDNQAMALLFIDLERLESEKQFDAFLHYLMGMVKRSLKQPSEALQSFTKAIRADKRMWLAWEELTSLVSSPQEISSLREEAEGYWFGAWFEAKALTRFSLQLRSLEIVESLSERGFSGLPMVLSLSATCHSTMFEHDAALGEFGKLREVEPYRIEDMNIYSDSLYIRGDRVQLASLTHSFYGTHRYFWETCAIVANYYSLRSEHEHAIRFLHRALRMNPTSSASTWTLLGHEFMEIKNNSAACLSYRKAIEIDPADYRGWYGLGQLYDILKMSNYALFYYKQAHKHRPQDSRMLVAMAEVFQRMNRHVDAERCFLKAFKIGDVEGTALVSLARHYESLNHNDNAASVYEKYLQTYTDEAQEDANVPVALLFLSRYFLEKRDFDAATSFAQRCMEYDALREEARTVIRNVVQEQQQEVVDVDAPYTPARGKPILDLEGSATTYDNPTADDDMAISEGEADESF